MHLDQEMTKQMGDAEGRLALSSAIHKVMRDMNMQEDPPSNSSIKQEKILREVYAMIKKDRYTDGRLLKMYRLLAPLFE